MAKNYEHLSDMERALIQAKLATLCFDHQPRAQALRLAGPEHCGAAAFLTPWRTKKMRSTGLKSSPSRFRVANPDTGMTESELLKRAEGKATALFLLADSQRATPVGCG